MTVSVRDILDATPNGVQRLKEFSDGAKHALSRVRMGLTLSDHDHRVINRCARIISRASVTLTIFRSWEPVRASELSISDRAEFGLKLSDDEDIFFARSIAAAIPVVGRRFGFRPERNGEHASRLWRMAEHVRRHHGDLLLDACLMFETLAAQADEFATMQA